MSFPIAIRSRSARPSIFQARRDHRIVDGSEGRHGDRVLRKIERQEAMKRFGWRWFAVSSVMVAALAAMRRDASAVWRRAACCHAGGADVAGSGGTGRGKFDPAKNAEPDSFARRSLTMLMFDTLVTTDESGRIQPSLATSGRPSPGSQRWQFRIRRGVKFHDGTPLTAETAAASLRAANPSWNVSADGDSVVIERARLRSESAGGTGVAAERDCEDELPAARRAARDRFTLSIGSREKSCRWRRRRIAGAGVRSSMPSRSRWEKVFAIR